MARHLALDRHRRAGGPLPTVVAVPVGLAPLIAPGDPPAARTAFLLAAGSLLAAKAAVVLRQVVGPTALTGSSHAWWAAGAWTWAAALALIAGDGGLVVWTGIACSAVVGALLRTDRPHEGAVRIGLPATSGARR